MYHKKHMANSKPLLEVTTSEQCRNCGPSSVGHLVQPLTFCYRIRGERLEAGRGWLLSGEPGSRGFASEDSRLVLDVVQKEVREGKGL